MENDERELKLENFWAMCNSKTVTNQTYGQMLDLNENGTEIPFSGDHFYLNGHIRASDRL